MKSVALVVGHSEDSPGACNKNGCCEFEFNDRLVNQVAAILSSQPVTAHVVHRDIYSRLPDDINELNPDFIISFHCNAFNGDVSGTETLYWHNSEKGKELADILQHELLTTLGLNNRGCKPIDDEDRGAHLLKYTKAPCVIAEPFFIDNTSDLNLALDKFMYLSNAFVQTIIKYISKGN